MMGWHCYRGRSAYFIRDIIQPLLFSAHNITLKPFSLNKYFNTSYNVPGVLHARRVNNIHNRFVQDGDHAEWFTPEVEEERHMEDVASMTDEQRLNSLTEKARIKDNKRKFLKSKVIERKYFRPLPACNILTSKAKEQIRYIYSMDPNEDGIESILQLFPITEKDLKLLLKQKRQIFKNWAEVVKHDASVYNKWIQLAESSQLSASLQLTLSRLVDSGQIDNLKNAEGVEGIPCPPISTLEDLAHQAPKVSGKLTRLLEKHGSFPLQQLPAKNEQQVNHQKISIVEPSVEELCREHQPETNHHSLFGKIVLRYRPKR